MPRFASFDGTELAFTVIGEGRPTLVLHGFLANADLNFVQPGIAGRIENLHRQVILPDLRGHGASDAPEDEAAYPPDALAMDQEALLRHLGISDYDLVGYSLGARTAMRMLVRGARPKRVVLGGMGDSGIMNVGARRAFFADGILNGANAKHPQAGAYIQGSIAERGLNPKAMLNVLAQQVDTSAAELATIDVPMLIVSGEDDADNGSAEKLAGFLPNAISKRVPGNHLTAVMTPELGRAIAGFLG